MKQYKVTGEGLHYCDKESTPVPVGAIVLEDQLKVNVHPRKICKFGNCPDSHDGETGESCMNDCLLPSKLLQEGYYNWLGEEFPVKSIKWINSNGETRDFDHKTLSNVRKFAREIETNPALKLLAVRC